MQAIDISRYTGQEHRSAPVLKDHALGASLRANVLTLELRASLALANGALRALRELGIVAAALDLRPLDGGPPRIDLGVVSRMQADRVLSVVDASTHDIGRQVYSAMAHGARLVWGIAR